MAMLVGLNEAKAYLRMDHADDDQKITFLIHACSGAVLNYLKRDLTNLDSDGQLFEDSEGVVEMEDEVKLAVLYWVGLTYRDPDGVEADKWTPGYPPTPIMNLLYPLRDPALA